MRLIYLDNAATTAVDPRVLEAMFPYLTRDFGNPGSLHSPGRIALEAVSKARSQVAGFFHCEPEQVIFTSGGSEGNNMIIGGLETELRQRGKTDVVVSAIEHDSVLKAARKLCIKDGFYLHYCTPDESGFIGVSSVEQSIKSTTGLVSVMTANNETGVLNNIPAIGALCRERGILFHTDAVQYAGMSELDTSEGAFSNVDFMTISGHKIHAPKGVGAIFARSPGLLSPLICGGAEQEFGFRGGTENVPGIVALGEACEIAQKEMKERSEKVSSLHREFLNALEDAAADAGIAYYVNGNLSMITPKTVSVRFPGVDAQTLLLMLDVSGVCVSAGSACTAHENEPSHVLTAMGLEDEDARSSVRVSFSFENTKDEVREAASVMIRSVSLLLRGS